MKKVFCYVRCSTEKQDTDMQLRDLTRYCAENNMEPIFFQETVSGKRIDNRPELQSMISRLKAKECDTLLIWKIDRLTRNNRDLMNIVHELVSNKIAIISYMDKIDLVTPVGIAMFQISGAFAELMVNNNRELTKAGMRAAKARGARLGKRPRKLNWSRFEELRRQGMPIRTIAKELGISRSQLYERLKSA